MLVDFGLNYSCKSSVAHGDEKKKEYSAISIMAEMMPVGLNVK